MIHGIICVTAISNPEDYTIDWICAITTEYVGAHAFLNEKYDGLLFLPHNKNGDTLLKMGKHKVVISALPMGEYCATSAARVAEDMMHCFPNIYVGLMVGHRRWRAKRNALYSPQRYCG